MAGFAGRLLIWYDQKANHSLVSGHDPTCFLFAAPVAKLIAKAVPLLFSVTSRPTPPLNCSYKATSPNNALSLHSASQTNRFQLSVTAAGSGAT